MMELLTVIAILAVLVAIIIPVTGRVTPWPVGSARCRSA